MDGVTVFMDFRVRVLAFSLRCCSNVLVDVNVKPGTHQQERGRASVYPKGAHVLVT